MAKKEEKVDKDEETAKKGGLSTVKIIIIVVTLTLVLGGGLVGATFYFVSGMNPPQTADKTADDANEDADEEGEAAEDKVLEPPHYFSMDPKFVVSFSNQKYARFMQFSLEVMSRDPEIIKKLEEHNPVIRSSLLMLFGSQGYDEMVTREGKEKLLKDTAADINNTLKKVTGNSDMENAVEAAYFTSFVIQ